MKTTGIFLLTAALTLAAVFTVGSSVADDTAKPAVPAAQPGDSTITAASDSVAQSHFIVYYFFTNVRCATCRKLEAYSQEAVDSGFTADLASGRLEFRGVNTDEKEHAHFLEDYELYTKSVILAEYSGNKQIRWKNLDKIWDRVGDKSAYLAYIRDELKAFMAAK